MAGLVWHRALLVPRATAAETTCTVCGRPMWLPASKVADYRRCSRECIKAHQSAGRETRKRNCETCSKAFSPRQRQIDQGGGRFCSQKCNTAAQIALLTPETRAKQIVTRRAMEAAGLVEHYKGERNPRWKGGPTAKRRRDVESGKSAAQVRRYRAKHPHRAREWAQNRKNRKNGRLPYGTIPRIGEAQKWKCAICRVGVRNHYHVDHIMPLARGGLHEPRNIQLLCQTCNVRKNAKDPIDYMQELGRLL